MKAQFNKADLKRLELALYYAYRDHILKSERDGDRAWKQAQEFEELRQRVVGLLKN